MTSRFIEAGNATFVREVSMSIISDAALQAARVAFEAHCLAVISAPTEGKRRISLTPHDTASSRECILSFWNFALATEAERRIEGDSHG